MASGWGASWGAAWGNSWGSIAVQQDAIRNWDRKYSTDNWRKWVEDEEELPALPAVEIVTGIVEIPPQPKRVVKDTFYLDAERLVSQIEAAEIERQEVARKQELRRRALLLLLSN